MKLKEALGEFFQQDDGGFSSKRLVVIGCSIALLVAFVANMFFGFKIDEFIFNSIKEIVIWGTGFVGAEKLINNLPFGNKETPE